MLPLIYILYNINILNIKEWRIPEVWFNSLPFISCNFKVTEMSNYR